ncbi:MAG: DNA polymerase III subunit beta, partial [Gammaproteobacteria bacterium]|nr:DNA polymerase III subunit beta [Gammaproteobacteria bacterium]
MKLTISREALLSPLQAIAGVVERKQTMPILANVLLAADAQGLTLTGTNIEVELVARVDLVQVHQPGRITVPARKLADICKALSENLMVDLSVDGDRLDIRAGSSHFRLSTLPADHFPNVEDDGERFSVQVAQSDLRTLL